MDHFRFSPSHCRSQPCVGALAVLCLGHPAVAELLPSFRSKVPISLAKTAYPKIRTIHSKTRHLMATESTPLLLGVSDADRAAFSARRQSLNAIAGGRQSEWGGNNAGLEEFRAIVARNRLLSRSEQRQDITEQVRSIIHDEPGLVAPRQRLDATTSIREVGILTAWVRTAIDITEK